MRELIRGQQRPAEAIRGKQWQSVAISGKQWQAVASSGNQAKLRRGQEASEREASASLLVPAVAAGANFRRPSEVDRYIGCNQRRPSRKRGRRVGRRAGATCVEDGAGDVPNGMVVRAVAAAE